MADKEVTFPEGSTLISVTDLKGVIQYCNRDFVDISGYSENELLKQNHNIVRHKDMPKAAFADLWETIKVDKPWQGLVKNRCKNGDYYWVEAYVTPVFQNSIKVGYQSVRSCPTRKQIASAESLYRTMLSDPQKKIPKAGMFARMKLLTKVNALLGLVLVSMLFERWNSGSLFNFSVSHLFLSIIALAPLAFLFYMINYDVISRVKLLTQIIDRISSGNLTEHIQAVKRDEIGKALISAKMLQGRFKAVLGRFDESVQSLSIYTDVLSETSYQTKASMAHQHLETDSVATAMQEMSATVQEIAKNTAVTSDLANTADDAAMEGKLMIESTRTTVLELSGDISGIATTVNLLAVECQKIRDITQTISSIADQTNLLALNAAIEAARAGENGRGFAVVADEVRSLASRTQKSTIEINEMIETLQVGSTNAVTAAKKGLIKVDESVEKIRSTEEAFNRIVVSITDVNDMNTQIATAAEEQSSVAEEMNSNVQSISEQSHNTTNNIILLEEKIETLVEMSESLKRQLAQYDLGQSAVRFDFDAAKNAHLAWKSKVRALISGDTSAVTKEAVCSHRECALGKWYYTDGMKQYKESQSFQQIEAPHERLHHIVKEVFQLCQKGEQNKAEKLYKELGPISDQIVSLLEKTEHSIR
jgi:aerotaxis receptor